MAASGFLEAKPFDPSHSLCSRRPIRRNDAACRPVGMNGGYMTANLNLSGNEQYRIRIRGSRIGGEYNKQLKLS